MEKLIGHGIARKSTNHVSPPSLGSCTTITRSNPLAVPTFSRSGGDLETYCVYFRGEKNLQTRAVCAAHLLWVQRGADLDPGIGE